MLIPVHHLSIIESFDFGEDDSPLPDLPHVVPIFFVPPLEDAPQNPIMDNLKIEEANLNLPKRTTRVKNRVELSSLKEKLEARRDVLPGSLEEIEKEAEVETIWREATKQKIGVSLCALTGFIISLYGFIEWTALLGQTPNSSRKQGIENRISV
jgi:hypothetical protein